MFERYLAEILASYCKDLLDDFDEREIRISVWKGEVVLNNLKLKPSALELLFRKKNESIDSTVVGKGGDDFPLQIIHGHVGTFELRIPWQLLRRAGYVSTLGSRSKAYHLSSASIEGCSLILSDVNVLVTPGNPCRNETPDGAVEHSHSPIDQNGLRASRIRKEQRVRNLLNKLLLRKDLDSRYASSGLGTGAHASDSDDNNRRRWVKDFVEEVLCSLSVTVRNVHIRYEDPGDCLGFALTNSFGSKNKNRLRPPFSVGITLAEFSVCSSDIPPGDDNELFHIPDYYCGPVRSDDNTKFNSEAQNIQSSTPEIESTSETGVAVEHKVIATQDLSVYWDSNTILMQSPVPDYHHHDRPHSSQCPFAISDPKVDNHQKVEGEPASHLDSAFRDLNIAQCCRISEKRHTYLIDPISPSVHFTIIGIANGDEQRPPQETNGSLESSTHSNSNGSLHGVNIGSKPHIRAVVAVPKFACNITKDILMDIAYLRKSAAFYYEAKTNLLSQQTYRRLSMIRPSESALVNPKGWWRYAVQSVIILSTHKTSTLSYSSASSNTGWRRFMHSMKLHKEYVSLYNQLLSLKTDEEKVFYCERLLAIEDMLEPEEIVAFRRSTVRYASTPRTLVHNIAKADRGVWSLPIIFTSEDLLSPKYREAMYLEMASLFAIDESLGYQRFSQFRFEDETSNVGRPASPQSHSSRVHLEMTIISPKISLQANDVVLSDRKPEFTPIVALSSAAVFQVRLRYNASWESSITFASLEMTDLAKYQSCDNEAEENSSPRCLLTRKTINWSSIRDGKELNRSTDSEALTIRIGTDYYFHSASIFVRRTSEESNDFSVQIQEAGEYIQRDSPCVVASVSIKISPMEIVYSPDPVANLSRMIASVKTPELTNDYQRLKHMVANWQSQQQRRIMDVLAKREKRLGLKVDIYSPVLLVHDEMSDGTLVVDFGRLTFTDSNDVEGSLTKKESAYDDIWLLSLSEIQAFCISNPVHHPRRLSNLRVAPVDSLGIKSHLVEPFSLEFVLKTRIGDDDWGDQNVGIGRINKVAVEATLPRLVFNLQSSAVRLVNRLNTYRNIRKDQFDASADDIVNFELQLPKASSITSGCHYRSSKTSIRFKFSAPLIAVRLTNDIDGRDCYHSVETNHPSAPTDLVELVIQGIGGNFSHTSFSDESKQEITFSAKMRSLYAFDMYQQAGDSFSALISSYPQHSETSRNRLHYAFTQVGGDSDSDSDLVIVDYETCRRNKYFDDRGFSKTQLGIKFHELYVEWNPETIAALQKAMRLSAKENRYFEDCLREHLTALHLSEDVNLGYSYPSLYTDEAVDIFFDAYENLDDIDTSSYLTDEFFATDDISTVSTKSHTVPEYSRYSPDMLNSLLFATLQNGSNNLSGGIQEASSQSDRSEDQDFSYVVHFELRRLKINFNKESRLRRLVTADMNSTAVTYILSKKGASKTNAKVGNLTFSDPASIFGNTLYEQILGLKNDSATGDSMLEVSFQTFPRFATLTNNPESDQCPDERLYPVHIDSEELRVIGSDFALDLHFSPMRFVYLQQLWLEIVDYFFEGILGYEVHGKDRPHPEIQHANAEGMEATPVESVPRSSATLPGADAAGLNFLKFIVVMENPVIILPATYRSPHYFKFSLDSIKASNSFTGRVERWPLNSIDSLHVQWYNTCSIIFAGLLLSSWCGKQLNAFDDLNSLGDQTACNKSKDIHMRLQLMWPTGPFSTLVMPRWAVSLTMNSVRCVLLIIIVLLVGSEGQNFLSDPCSFIFPNSIDFVFAKVITHCFNILSGTISARKAATSMNGTRCKLCHLMFL